MMEQWEQDWEFPHIISNGTIIKCTTCEENSVVKKSREKLLKCFKCGWIKKYIKWLG